MWPAQTLVLTYPRRILRGSECAGVIADFGELSGIVKTGWTGRAER